MRMKEREALHYNTPTGRAPFLKWHDSIRNAPHYAAIALQVDRMAMGNFGNHKPVGKGVNEVKINKGPGFRIYYAIYKDTFIILLGGGSKKNQQKEIELAQKYWADFKNRQR